jgi:hypothetical protein
MKKFENNLFKAINQILWIHWDPIGINWLKGCNDEYADYVPEIYRLKMSGSDQETIALKLYELALDEMGIELEMEFCSEVAGRIIGT